MVIRYVLLHIHELGNSVSEIFLINAKHINRDRFVGNITLKVLTRMLAESDVWLNLLEIEKLDRLSLLYHGQIIRTGMPALNF